MNAKETLELISKQWCTFEELKKLSQLGNNALYNIKKEITDELKAQGYILPTGLLPISYVVKKLNIDIDYLIKMSKI